MDSSCFGKKLEKNILSYTQIHLKRIKQFAQSNNRRITIEQQIKILSQKYFNAEIYFKNL